MRYVKGDVGYTLKFEDASGEECTARPRVIVGDSVLAVGVNDSEEMTINKDMAAELATALLYFAEKGELPDGPL